MRRYALTAIGQDRPGIVAAVTKALYEHDCNIEDSSMTTLEDEFAIILIMSMDEGSDAASLAKELKKVEKEVGLTIHFKEISKTPQKISPPGNYILNIHGADKAGIVYKTASLLAGLGLSITDLETKIIGTEKPIYIMLLEVYAPEGSDIKKAEDGLKALEAELGVTIRLKPVEDYEPL